MLMNKKQSLVSWTVLILLTLLSVYIGKVFDQPAIFITCVLLIVFLKGQQIVDVFMELKHAPKRWRLLIMSYVLLVPFVLLIIYIL